MNNLVNLIRENINDAVTNLGYEIYHIEYVNEFGHNYLRIMITHKDDLDKKITIKDCEIVAKSINILIDNLDLKDKFFLEVSSPGVNRKLYTLKHMRDAIDKIVCIRMIKGFEGNKRYIGILKFVDDKGIKVSIKNQEFDFGFQTIKNINLEEISQEDIHE